MENAKTEDAGGTTILPLSPSNNATNVKFGQASLPKLTIVRRHGLGGDGRQISLITNYFRVGVNCSDGMFYQYDVSITSEENRPVKSLGIRRKLIHRACQTCSPELLGMHIAYDGEKTLYTMGPLPRNKVNLKVALEETFAKCESGSVDRESQTGKKLKHSFQAKTFHVLISYASKVPVIPLSSSLKGTEIDVDSQDALRVLNAIVRQQAANRGCLLAGQSFFHDDSCYLTDIGGGLNSCRGFHSRFCTTQSGLSLNMDVSTILILKPGPVIDFLLANQNVRDPRYIDWEKAKKMLKNLRIKTQHTNREFKIYGISEKPCLHQTFSLKVKINDNGITEGQTVETTVHDYFTKRRQIVLSRSVYMPCLNVGKSEKPNYLPIELCDLVSLQRYKKALSPFQRLSLVEKSRQKPQEQIQIVTDAVRNYNYDREPLIASCGITVEKLLTRVDGRVLEAPNLKVGELEECIPSNGRWSFKNKQLLIAKPIELWAVVNFSASCDTSFLSRELISCGRNKGIHMERPHTLIEEDPQYRKSSAASRVEAMFEQITEKLPNRPDFLLCVLPERKCSELYGPWKKKSLCDIGIATQCISPIKITDNYLTNVLLKINSKLGGINSLLAMEYPSCTPLIKDNPTMILGMNVNHGSRGQSETPTIAAVAGSRAWPLISRYKALVRTQSPVKEMIDCLYKPLTNGDDDGVIRELLLEFYNSSSGRKPAQFIVFRDGVSKLQFNKVLDIELQQIMKAYLHLGATSIPKFTVVVAQRNHHTKLFQAGAPANVPPGTVVDTNIVHPINYDFFICSHSGTVGTSRPTRYTVLLDEIGFSVDELQNFINALSYVNQRSSSAVSVVAPLHYARLAAQQVGQFVRFEDSSETGDVQKEILVQELPRLHERVRDSMFFC